MAIHERSCFPSPIHVSRTTCRPARGARLYGDAGRRARSRAVCVHAVIAVDAARRRRVQSAADRHPARRLAGVVQLRGLLRRRVDVRGVARRARADGALGAGLDRSVDTGNGRHEPVLGLGGGTLHRRGGERLDFRVRVAMGPATARGARSACLERRDLHGAGRGHRRDRVACQRGGRLWRDGGLARLWLDLGGSGGGCVVRIRRAGRFRVRWRERASPLCAFSQNEGGGREARGRIVHGSGDGRRSTHRPTKHVELWSGDAGLNGARGCGCREVRRNHSKEFCHRDA